MRARVWGGLAMLVGLLIGLAFRPLAVLLPASAALGWLSAGLARRWQAKPGNKAMRAAGVGAAGIAVLLAGSWLARRYAPAAADIHGNYHAWALSMLGRLTEPAMLKHVFTVGIPTLLEESMPEALFGTQLAPGLNSLASLFAIFGLCWTLRRRPAWAWLVLLLLATLVLRQPRTRYLLMVQPLMIAGYVAAWACLLSRLAPPHRGRVLAAALLVPLLTNIGYGVKLIIEQRRTPFTARYAKGAWQPAVDAAAALRALDPQPLGVIACDNQSRTLSFLSGLPVENPEDELLGQPWAELPRLLRQRGYRWAILTDDGRPDAKKSKRRIAASAFDQALFDAGVIKPKLDQARPIGPFRLVPVDIVDP